jgi:hypothetical protein
VHVSVAEIHIRLERIYDYGITGTSETTCCHVRQTPGVAQ